MNDVLNSMGFAGTSTDQDTAVAQEANAGSGATETTAPKPKKERKEGEKRTVSISRLERLIEAKKVSLTNFFSELISFAEGKEAEGAAFGTLGEALTAYAQANSRKGSSTPRNPGASAADKAQRNMIQFLFDSGVVKFGELVEVKKSRKGESLYNAEFKQSNGNQDKIWVDFTDNEYVKWGIHNTVLGSVSKEELKTKMEA